MIQVDFEVNQVNHFTKTLFELFLNKEHQNYEKTKDIVNSEISRITDLDLNTFLMISPNHLLKEYRSSTISLAEIKYVADLLFYVKDIKPINKLSVIRRLISYYLFLDDHNLSCIACLKTCIEEATLSNVHVDEWERLISFFIDHNETQFAERLVSESIALQPNNDSVHGFATNYFFSA